MDYQEALAYIYRFTDYERGGKYIRNRNENLLREEALLELLGNPHHAYTNTLIAGTKGKGSTSAFIERVLRESGIRTGLYTQPDLHNFRERSRVNGQLISEEEAARLIAEIRTAVERIEERHVFEPFITYEIGTALAFLYFARQQVEHAVVEVGLGGRLDATNVTHPLVSVIASISYDHVAILGDTLAKIATEKAGIIKQDGLVVTSAQSPEALLAIAHVAQQRNARMVRIGAAESDTAQAEVNAGQLPPLTYRYHVQDQGESGQHFSVEAPGRTYVDLWTPLVGRHQVENATLALATLEILREQGISWNDDALWCGFASVHWPARIQVVGHEPAIVVDGAHNADSMEKLLATVRSVFSFHRLFVVLGMNKDKDLAHMVQVLADCDGAVLTRADNPRAVSLKELEDLFASYAPTVPRNSVENSFQALDLACDQADRQDLICVTGSLYLAGEALRWAAARGDQVAASDIEGVDH